MTAGSPVEMIIEPRRRSIGTDEVDRLLPVHRRRMVGPFIYADLLGPTDLPAGVGVDVPVHPHIGLATVTYLFSGSLVHRDSTGAVQRIDPGAVNWMVAGSGVSHSERSPDDERSSASAIAGLQTWVALPDDAETIEPSFTHVAAERVPTWIEGEVRVHLIAGTLSGRSSRVPVQSPMTYADVRFGMTGTWSFPPDVGERGVIVVDAGAAGVTIDGVAVRPRHLAVLAPDAEGVVTAPAGARVIAIGGEPVGERVISWNFVASDRALVERAEAAWRAGDWPMVAGDDEIVPLP